MVGSLCQNLNNSHDNGRDIVIYVVQKCTHLSHHALISQNLDVLEENQRQTRNQRPDVTQKRVIVFSLKKAIFLLTSVTEKEKMVLLFFYFIILFSD